MNCCRLLETRPGQSGDHRAHIAFKQVGAHAGHVAHVVAHVVGDDGGVAGVVLGDTDLDLADQVGADVSGLGVDAAAHTGKQRDGGGAQGEAEEDARVFGDEVEQTAAQQAQAHHAHAHDGAAGKGDGQGAVHAALLGGLGGADVGLGGHTHAEKAGQDGKDGASDKADRGAPIDEEADQEEQNCDENGENLIFRGQEGGSTLGDRTGDLLHPRVAGIGLVDKGGLAGCKEQCAHGKDRCNPDKYTHNVLHS